MKEKFSFGIKKSILCVIAGQFIVIGICFLIYPFFNIFNFLMNIPFWVGIPLLIIAGLIFQWSFQNKRC